MFSLVSCLVIFLLYLITERILLNRSVGRIPVRIAVTGTRGKSSVVRMLASVLREDGRQVLAKTTGSEAVLLLPDGSLQEVKRRGIASIREQIGLVRRAAHMRADCLVSEIMSIHPENHFFEAQRILQPGFVVVTNVRLDHTEVMGETEDAVAAVLSLDIPRGATVFIPQRHSLPILVEAARSRGTLVQVPERASAALLEAAPDLGRAEFSENLDLVCGVARHLNIGDATILKGIARTRYDIGKLKMWRACSEDKLRSYYLVNGFAANDPESTFQVLARVLEHLPASSDKVIGILNLRADRGARTLQWIATLKRSEGRFRKVFVTGSHSGFVRRHLAYAQVLKSGSPEAMTAAVSSDAAEGSVIFGFGNVKGAGVALVKYWSKLGEEYGI